MGICTIDNCDRLVIARKFCSKHYQRYKKYGDPLFTQFSKAKDGEPEAWIRSVALQYEGQDCLEYPFSLAKGYGQLWVSGKRVNAHRSVCTLAHGQPPSTKHAAAHSCGNARCVNPNHLVWKTYVDNEADKLLHGTRYRGEDVSTSKLTEQQVLEIFQASGFQQDIADHYGVSRRTVGMIKTGKIWAWLTEGLSAVASTGSSKLTEVDAAEIRSLANAGMKQREIAEMFGVTQSNVSNIIIGNTWKSVSRIRSYGGQDAPVSDLKAAASA